MPSRAAKEQLARAVLDVIPRPVKFIDLPSGRTVTIWSAGGGSRTPTSSRSDALEAPASTSSATPANKEGEANP